MLLLTFIVNQMLGHYWLIENKIEYKHDVIGLYKRKITSLKSIMSTFQNEAFKMEFVSIGSLG